MNNNQNSKWINQQEIKSQILEIRRAIDRNLRDYLVLRLEQMDGIFVFALQVPENRWGDLSEGKEYTFEIGENERGYKNLLDFDFV